MKNIRGFTLIELTMAVLILAAVTLIAVPVVRTILNNSREKAYQIAVETIEEAAKSYHYMNENTIKDDLNTIGHVNVTVVELKEQGFILKDIENPRDKTIMNGYVEIRKITSTRYEYEYFNE